MSASRHGAAWAAPGPGAQPARPPASEPPARPSTAAASVPPRMHEPFADYRPGAHTLPQPPLWRPPARSHLESEEDQAALGLLAFGKPPAAAAPAGAAAADAYARPGSRAALPHELMLKHERAGFPHAESSRTSDGAPDSGARPLRRRRSRDGPDDGTDGASSFDGGSSSSTSGGAAAWGRSAPHGHAHSQSFGSQPKRARITLPPLSELTSGLPSLSPPSAVDRWIRPSTAAGDFSRAPNPLPPRWAAGANASASTGTAAGAGTPKAHSRAASPRVAPAADFAQAARAHSTSPHEQHASPAILAQQQPQQPQLSSLPGLGPAGTRAQAAGQSYDFSHAQSQRALLHHRHSLPSPLAYGALPQALHAHAYPPISADVVAGGALDAAPAASAGAYFVHDQQQQQHLQHQQRWAQHQALLAEQARASPAVTLSGPPSPQASKPAAGAKPMKRVRKKGHEHHQRCLGCGVSETPEWRKGPTGPRTLCNACGLLCAKMARRLRGQNQARRRLEGTAPGGSSRENSASGSADASPVEEVTLEMLHEELFHSGVRVVRDATVDAGGVAAPSGGPAPLQTSDGNGGLYSSTATIPAPRAPQSQSTPVTAAGGALDALNPQVSAAAAPSALPSPVTTSAPVVSSQPATHGAPSLIHSKFQVSPTSAGPSLRATPTPHGYHPATGQENRP